MSSWVLCYWVRGQPLDGLTTVNVSPSTTIHEFKKRIIELNFLSLMPSSIHVYKVPDDKPVPDDDSMENVLGALSISMLGKPLRATRQLSNFFNPPIPESQLHLIVDVPSLLVRCWLCGADRASSFAVRALASESLDLLKKAIKAKLLAILADVPITSLKLYKISAAYDDLAEILGTTGAEQLFDGGQPLGTAFSDVPFSQYPSVLIEWLDARDPIASARIEFLAHAPKAKPSSSGMQSSFRTRQGGRNFIPCGRPRDPECNDEETIPTTLLHPVFGQFVDDCQSIEVKAEDNRLAHDLEIAMSKLYSDEAERVCGVNEVLRRYQIHFTISKIQKTNYLLNGDMSVGPHRYVIAEFKNEAGNTSAEPYFEAIAYYLESTRELAPKYLRSPLPCLILAIFGPYIVFAGAAWNLRPAVQVLSTPVAFHFHPTDTQNQIAVARHMAAFRKATKTLKEYYTTLEGISLSAAISPAIQIFPHPTTYESLHSDAEKKMFRYEREVVEKQLIFFATEESGGDKICVKFTRTYSLHAHQYLASIGCAPALRGFEKIPGGWFLVVLDALSDFETLHARKEPLPSSFFANMSEKLAMFHGAGFVHGDIRDVNIMVSKKDADKFMFVDFDWSGRIGEALYPARVNTTSIRRPPDAFDGNIITAAHDVFMLDCIRQSKCRN